MGVVLDAIGTAAAFPFRVGGGFGVGAGTALYEGAASKIVPVASGQYTGVRDVTYNFVGKGMREISGSGIISNDFANITSSGGWNKFFTTLFKSGKLTTPGIGLLIVAVALAGFGAVIGYQALMSEGKKASDLMKGRPISDYSQNVVPHTIAAAGGLGMLAGALSFIPALGLLPAAIPLILGGAALYYIPRKGMDIMGSNLVAYPKDSLPWPLYLPFESSAAGYRETVT